jgi:membrane dipeptidase
LSVRPPALLLAAVAAATLAAPLDSRGGTLEKDPPFLVVDLHVDLPWQVHYKGRSPALTEGHATLTSLAAGGYGGLVFPIYLPDSAPHREAARIEDADAIFATIERVIGEHALFLPLTARAAEPGRISTFLSIEGGGAFAADVTQIDRFIARGLRLVSPCHGKNSLLSSSATGEKVAWGLTPLGKQFAERVYAGGALVDVSHVSDASFADIAAIARAHAAPVVATHSNARAVAAQPRNLTDDELRVIRDTGGVTGVNFHAPFVTGSNDATLADVVKQVDHLVAVAGVDHVAIGSDFDGGIKPPEGLGDASTLPALAAALRAEGMSADDVLKIFSLNALRVLGWRPPGTGLPLPRSEASSKAPLEAAPAAPGP